MLNTSDILKVDTNDNDTNQLKDEESFVGRTQTLSLVVCFFESVVLLIALIGNLAVCVIIFSVRKLWKISSILIVNLAIVDFLFAVTNIPVSMYALIMDIPTLSKLLCNVNGVLLSTTALANILTITSIAVCRYIQICHFSMYTRYVTRNLSIGIVCAIWISSCLFAILPVFGWGEYTFHYEYTVCILHWYTSLWYFSILLMVQGLIPFTTMTVAYATIIRTVLKSRRAVTATGLHENTTWYQVSLVDVQLSKMSFIVYIAFICCWLPFSVVDGSAFSGYHYNVETHTIAATIVFLTAAIDPVVYAFMNGPFQKECIRILKMRKQGLNNGPQRTAVIRLEG